MICDRCGTHLALDSAFCHRCGRATGLEPWVHPSLRRDMRALWKEDPMPWDRGDPLSAVREWLRGKDPNEDWTDEDADRFLRSFKEKDVPEYATVNVRSRLAIADSVYRKLFGRREDPHRTSIGNIPRGQGLGTGYYQRQRERQRESPNLPRNKAQGVSKRAQQPSQWSGDMGDNLWRERNQD